MPEVSTDQKIINVLCDALGVDSEECTPDAKIFSNLGAESIDSLDIFFRFERALGTRVHRNDIACALFDISPEVFDSVGWDAAEQQAATAPTGEWTTAPGTVGRLQEMARKNFRFEQKPVVRQKMLF